MKKLMRYGRLFVLLLWFPVLVGCQPTQAQNGPPPPRPPEVHVSTPVTREVIDYEEFPGRLEAVHSIEIRARATGYLLKVHFKEGEDVKEKDLLFEIDPRLYEAQLARADATLVQSEAHVKRLDADFQRAGSLLAKGAIGREEYDKVVADRAEAGAGVEVARANRHLAEVNLGFCKVRAPISGRISRRFIDPGNLVKADETPLTSLVSLDPMHASFDLDERTTLKLRKLIRTGKIKWSTDRGMPVMIGLADEEGFPHKGTINFGDNRVDAETGTWRLRGLFANPKQILAPGLYVRVRLPIGDPFPAILISEQALGTDQGQKFVYVVDDEDKVSYRRVKVGRLHDGLRVISEGLKADEKVVVSGLQRIRPNIQVNPKEVEMPVVGANGKSSPEKSDKVKG